MRPDLLIRDARRAAGLTQAELAARLGISQSAIAKLEREGSNPTVETLDRVLRPTGHRLQLIAPAWGTIDLDLIRQALERTPAERIKSVERMHKDMRRLQAAAARSRERAA
jgi:transcriptional regulator with XRE-family HTH domain